MIIISSIYLRNLIQRVKQHATSSKPDTNLALTALKNPVMIKVYKPDFEVNIPTFIIRNTWPETGMISKVKFDRVNQLIRWRLGLLHWINTPDVINLINGISDKRNCSFIQHGIVDFYMSVCRGLI